MDTSVARNVEAPSDNIHFISTDIEVPTLTIDPDVVTKVRQELDAVTTNPYDDFDGFLAQIKPIYETSLTTDDLVKVSDYISGFSTHGCIKIKGLPVDTDLPPTPVTRITSIKKAHYYHEADLLYFSSLLGEKQSFKEETHCKYIHNIFPIPDCKDSLSNAGCSQDFLFHTEIAFHPNRPNFIGLCGQRVEPKNNPCTLISDIRTAIKYLSDQDIDTLSQPRFQIGRPESFEQNTQTDITPLQVLIPHEDAYRLRVNFNTTKGIDLKAQLALKHLFNALMRPDVCLKQNLQPGEIIFIDNRYSVHAREAFESDFVGDSRWLLRIYIK